MKTGQILREKRRAARMTQLALANVLNLSGQAIGNFEAGRSLPTQRMLNEIAVVLKCEPSELVGEDGVREMKLMDESEKVQALNENVLVKNRRIRELEEEVERLRKIDKTDEISDLRAENKKLRDIIMDMMLDKWGRKL